MARNFYTVQRTSGARQVLIPCCAEKAMQRMAKLVEQGFQFPATTHQSRQ